MELGSLGWIEDPVAAAKEHAAARPAAAQTAETSQTSNVLLAERPGEPQAQQERPEPIPAPAAASSSDADPTPVPDEAIQGPPEPILPPEPELPPDPLLDAPAAQSVPPEPPENQQPVAAAPGRAPGTDDEARDPAASTTPASTTPGDGDLGSGREAAGDDTAIEGVVAHPEVPDPGGEGGVRRIATPDLSPAAETDALAEPALAEPVQAEASSEAQGMPSVRQGADAVQQSALDDASAEDASDGDLERGFQDLLAVFAERTDRDFANEDPVPTGPYATPDTERVTRAFEQLKRALADQSPDNPVIAAINAAAAQDRGSGSAASAPLTLPPGLEPLHVALGDAQAHSSWYYSTPQWQQVRSVTTALRNLTSAITAAPGSYLDGVGRDVRARGFLRMVTARASRVVSQACRGIAAGLEKAGYRDTPAWLAVQTLHTRSADFADQLMGHLPPGWTLETLDGLRENWAALRSRISGTGQGDSQDGPVSRTAIADLRTALASGGRAAGDRVTGSRAWQRLSGIWDGAQPVLAQTHREVLRFEEDAADLGALRTAWSRTCELASATARHGMNRLEVDAPDDAGAGWHALRLLHHVAEQNLAHLRGDLPSGQRAPLGTYDRHATGSALPAPTERSGDPRGAADHDTVTTAPRPPRPTVENSPPAAPPEPGGTGQRSPHPPAGTVAEQQPVLEASPPPPEVVGPAEPTAAENDAGAFDRNWAQAEFMVGRPPRNEHIAQMYPQWERELPRPTDPKVLGPIVARLEAYDAYNGPLSWTEWITHQHGSGAGGPAAPEQEPPARPPSGGQSSAAAIASAAFPQRVSEQIKNKGAQPSGSSLPDPPPPRPGLGDRITPERGER